MREDSVTIDNGHLKLIGKACELIANSHTVVAFTGAGVSSESGISVFRGSGGIWQKFNPALYGNLPGLALVFILNPERIEAFVREAASAFAVAKPNSAHESIAKLEHAGFISGVITQNVDNLHREAGSLNIFEVHGNIFRARCLKCGAREDLPKRRLLENITTKRNSSLKRRELLRLLDKYTGRCACGGRRRPDIVMFGEPLPRGIFRRAMELAMKCDCIIAAGTSAIVYPAASIPEYAVRKGATLIEINPERTGLTPFARLWIPLRASVALGEIFKQLTGKANQRAGKARISAKA